MALPLKRTLEDIRSDILLRLGFGMAGSAGIINSKLIDSMIISAQNQLYEQFDWADLRAVEETLTGTDQQFYDYPVDCNIERINFIAVKWGGRYQKLVEGIRLEDRGFLPGGVPLRYERRDQIELWPVPTTGTIPIRIEYIKTLAPLVENTDRVRLPSEMVYLHALANAKAHYRQPDSQSYASQLDALIEKLKAKHRTQTVWSRSSSPGVYDDVDGSQDV